MKWNKLDERPILDGEVGAEKHDKMKLYDGILKLAVLRWGKSWSAKGKGAVIKNEPNRKKR